MMESMDGQLITSIAGFLVAAAGWLKSHTEVNAVKRDRETTKAERDTEIAVLKSKVGDLEKRLGDGDNRFARLETQMGQMNGTLNNILGKVDLLVTLKEKK